MSLNKTFQTLPFLRTVIMVLPLSLFFLTGCGSGSDSNVSATTNENSPTDEGNTLTSGNNESDSTDTETDTEVAIEETDEGTDSESIVGDDDTAQTEGPGQQADTSEGENNEEDNDNESVDSDGDLLTDQQEIELGTNPFNSDSDGDGKNDNDEDLDEDGVGNYIEYAVNSSPIEFDEPRFVYTQRALTIFLGDSAVLTEDGVDDFNGWLFSEYFYALSETEDVNRKIRLTLRGKSVSAALATERVNYLSDLSRSSLSTQNINVIIIPPLINTDAPEDIRSFDERVRIEWIVTSEGGDVGSSIIGYTGFIGDD